MAPARSHQAAGTAAPEPSIRSATPADAEAIVRLVRALAAHVGDVSLAEVSPSAMAEAGSGTHPLWQGVLAETGGEVIGVCLYSLLFSTWIGAPGMYVIDLYVVPEFRHLQLGRRLLAAAAKTGRDQGCRFIRLEVDHRNTQVEGFYARLGFAKRANDSIFLLKADAFDALASS